MFTRYKKKEDIPSQYKNFSYDVPQFIMDGNIDIHKVLISMEENSKNVYLSVGGKNKSGRNIEGLLLEIELLSPFEKVLWKNTIEFFQITKNGDLFTTNYKQIEFPIFCEERILYANISMKNIFADGRKLYSLKE